MVSGQGTEEGAIEALDDGFQYYASHTIDPGPWLIVATLALAALLYMLLFVLVEFCERRKHARDEKVVELEDRSRFKGQSESTAQSKSTNRMDQSNDEPINNCACGVEVIDFDQYNDNPWPDWIAKDFHIPKPGGQNWTFRRHRRGATQARIKKMERQDKKLKQRQEQRRDLHPSLPSAHVQDISGIFNYDPKTFEKEQDEINYKSGYFGRLLRILRWDRENNRIMNLALPYMAQVREDGTRCMIDGA